MKLNLYNIIFRHLEDASTRLVRPQWCQHMARWPTFRCGTIFFPTSSCWRWKQRPAPVQFKLLGSVWRYPKSQRNQSRNFFPIPNPILLSIPNFVDTESDTCYKTNFFILNPKLFKNWIVSKPRSFETETPNSAFRWPAVKSFQRATWSAGTKPIGSSTQVAARSQLSFHLKSLTSFWWSIEILLPGSERDSWPWEGCL